MSPRSRQGRPAFVPRAVTSKASEIIAPQWWFSAAAGQRLTASYYTSSSYISTIHGRITGTLPSLHLL